MKANAPDKIYACFGVFGLIQATEIRATSKDIEYTRTDAFIERVCKWIEEFNNHHHIMRYSDSCEPPLSELTEWFKNYMKGEQYGIFCST